VGHDSQTITPTSSLPTPAPLTAAAMTAATHGWTPAWIAQTPEDAQLAPGPTQRCLNRSPELSSTAAPTRGSGNLFFRSGEATTFALLFDFEGKQVQANGLWASLTAALDQCDTASAAGQRVWDGGEARSFALVSASGLVEHAWVAHEGTAIGLLWVTDAPTTVPSSVDDGVASALVAALTFPASMKDVTGSTSTSESSSSVASVGISQVDFADALGDWQSGWSTTSGNVPDPGAAPCGVDLANGGAFGDGTTLGANGQQGTSGFDHQAAARRALQTITDDLTACSSSTYDVQVEPTQDGSVTVAAGTGSDADVTWLVQEGRQIAYVVIPAGDTLPPDSVTAKVGDLLASNLRANSAIAQESTTPHSTTSKDAAPVR
jgi:hypothetical protein